MFIQHPRYLIRAVLLLAAVSLAGCASSAKFRSDYDRDADFGSYKTYNYMDRSNQDNYQDLFSKYMMEAIDVQMTSRGYTKSDNPDLLVNFSALLQDKTKVTTTPSSGPMMGGGYYGYRAGYYGAWGGYGYGTETHVSQYTEGTFNIDLVDANRKQLVWEGVGIGRVNDESFENLEEKVHEGVPKFFAMYPFVAGNPNPQM
jgi:hypothetical protein